MTDEKKAELYAVPEEQHESILLEFRDEISPWHELSDQERNLFIEKWRKKWSWERSLNTILEETSATSLPWEVPRIIGHRGAGKTHSA